MHCQKIFVSLVKNFLPFGKDPIFKGACYTEMQTEYQKMSPFEKKWWKIYMYQVYYFPSKPLSAAVLTIKLVMHGLVDPLCNTAQPGVK